MLVSDIRDFYAHTPESQVHIAKMARTKRFQQEKNDKLEINVVRFYYVRFHSIMTRKILDNTR